MIELKEGQAWKHPQVNLTITICSIGEDIVYKTTAYDSPPQWRFRDAYELTKELNEKFKLIEGEK